MLWWVKRGLGLVFRFVLRFLFRSLSRIMSCFFNCFRIRDHRQLPTANLISNPSPSTEVLISQNHFSTLFQPQEPKDSAGKGNVVVWSQGEEDEQGLKDEAKFLKACGTLGGTPAEIKKVSKKLNVSPPGKDCEPSKFHSWLPSTSVEKLQLDVQPFEPPSPIELCQESGNTTDSFECTPTSCISNAEDTKSESLDYFEGSRTGILHSENRTEKNAAPISPSPATNTQKNNKSVRFECETNSSSCGNSSDDWHMKKSKSPSNQRAYKPSPYPTPLKLFDEMQTPGTVYPASFEELPNGKPRVRSQFVFPVYNPGENVFRCNILEEKDFTPEADPDELSDSIEQAQNATPTPEKWPMKISDENKSKLEASLSSCLKPASIIQEEKHKIMETACNQTPYFRKPLADRPVVGAVASPWNIDDASHISPPKWWDGNGIPNSTTKYKEDQKVNWHATPFEERLEKALSEGTFISQRKVVYGKPVEFDEIEESDDKELCQQQSSNHQQSVVSS